MVSNISDFLRREPNIAAVGIQKPERASADGYKGEHWHRISNAVLMLFQKKKLEDMELDILITKVRTLKSQSGPLVYEFYRNSILKKGMIILRETVKSKTGALLLEKLSQVWTDFYCIVLPMLQAIFDCVTLKDGLSIRDITLASFRDIVVFKTKLDEALDAGLEVSPRIQQMLLVLQSVHDCNPQDPKYVKIESLVMKVVYPYLSLCDLKKSTDGCSDQRKNMPRSKSVEAAKFITDEARQLRRPFSIQE